jgi:hypothetical protein
MRIMDSRSALFVGITPKQNSLLLSSFARGRASINATFPDTPMSAEAIRIYLCDHDGPVGLAVDTALIDFALQWARTTLATTTVVPSEPKAQAWMLARYASKSL